MTITRKTRHSCCLAIDSDGCVFDSMRMKQESCFIPQLINVWKLEDARQLVTEKALHLNLHSRHRGENRFKVLLKLFEELHLDPRLQDSPLASLEVTPLRTWINSGAPLSIPSLEKAIREKESPILRDALQWTLAVNQHLATLPPATPFSEAVQALRAAFESCEIRVVSSANREALEREWADASLDHLVDQLNGQEQGRKEALLRDAAEEFGKDRVLMIGDAPADKEAAQNAGVLFFPIQAGNEDEGWRSFRTEIMPRFLQGLTIREDLSAHLSSWESLMGLPSPSI